MISVWNIIPFEKDRTTFQMVCYSRTFFTGTTRKAVSYSLFDRIFLNFCKWQTTFTSETEWDGKKKFGIIEQKFAFSSSAEISFLTSWFPSFTWTNEVRSFSACCNKGDVLYVQASFGQTGSKPVNKKCMYSPVEVELKRLIYVRRKFRQNKNGPVPT